MSVYFSLKYTSNNLSFSRIWGVIMNLTEKTHTKISENKVTFFVLLAKKNENPHTEIVEDPC